MMISIVDRFRLWVQVRTPVPGFQRFRLLFAGIWLTYDLMDLIVGGTQAPFWFYQDRTIPNSILFCQLGLILSQFCVILQWRPQGALVIAACLRALEIYFFPLNDFIYYCVTAILLAHFDFYPDPRLGQTQAIRGQLWVRDILILETAWIYFCTAFLKLNPSWLSGGDLYSRQMLQFSMRPWFYPLFLKTALSKIQVEAGLAKLAVLGEFSLAGILVSSWYSKRPKKGLIRFALFLALGIHGFAVWAMNVWFFGASMVAQVFVAVTSKGEET